MFFRLGKDLAPIVELAHDVAEDLPRAMFVARFSVPRYASLIDKDEASPNTLSIRRFSHSSLYTYPKLIISTHLPVLLRQD